MHDTELNKVVTQVIDSCVETKARDITVLEMSGLTEIADYFIIASGRSNSQVQGIANRIIDQLEEDKTKPLCYEGIDNGKWAVIDYGDVIVHVFHEGIRDSYSLEDFWHGAKKTSVTCTPEGKLNFLSAA